MKTILLTVSQHLLFLTLLFFSELGMAQPGHLLFTARLSGAEEVPAVTTNGEGLVNMIVSADRTKMLLSGAVTNLSGPVTAAHFHAGEFGQTGGVVVSFASIISGNRISGELPIPAGFLEKALTFGIYANVHTALNPAGEIRGQLEPESDLNFNGTLSGLFEAPPVLTTAIGVGNLNLTAGSGKAVYSFIVKGLSGPITAAHIHTGDFGVSGPVLVALSFSGNRLVGELDLSALPADFVENLLAAKYYVNVHTAANPAGEIRAQLSFSSFLNGFAALNGDQETPPVTTAASGFGFFIPHTTLDSVVYAVLVDGLSGPATAAHVHKAPAGTSGAVVFGLTAVPAVPGFYTATVPMAAGTLTDFLNNDLYFNVHTAANPAGEIRGQIQTNLRKGYVFDLCGAQEVPGNSSTAYGAGISSIDQGNLTLNYRVLADGLSGPATAAHFHTGNAGVSGAVKFAIAVPNPFSEGSIAITGNDALLIENEGAYMNVHTAANPAGEIRGQVRRGLLCSPNVAVFDPAVQQLQVFPNPVGDALFIRFESAEGFEAQLRLTDVSGRILSDQSKNVGSAGLQEWRLPVQDLNPGLYFLHVIREGKIVLVQSVLKM